MADEDEVRQDFVADASEYIRPLEEAEEAAKKFADANQRAKDAVDEVRDAASESTGSIDDLAASEDGATEAAANFAEAEDRIRNALLETDHELHEQSESFFAQAIAEDAAAEAADRFAAAQDRAAQRAGSMEGTLRDLRSALSDLELGEAVVARKTDLGTFSLAAENDELDRTRETSVRAGTGIRMLDDAMDRARDKAADLTAAAAFLNISLKDTDRVAKEARDALTEMGASETEAAGGAFALAAAARAARDAEDKLKEGGGFFSMGGGGGSLLSSLMDPGAIAAFVTGIAAVVPLIAAILVEVTGLISGLAAAGAGVGAFALLALPAIKKVGAGYTAVTAAEGKYRAAVRAENKDDDTKNIKATAAALAKLKAAWGAMDPAERGAVRGIQELKSSYERMAKAFEPDVFKIFNQGLRIANELLPDFKPFADNATKAISPLLGLLANFLKTSKTVLEPIGKEGHGLVPVQVPTGFGTWLAQFQKLSGPSLTAIGLGIGSVANALGKLFTVMSAKDDVRAINIAFGILRGTIELVAHTVRVFMRDWDAMSGSIKEAIKNVGRWNADILRFAKVLDDDAKKAFDTSERDIKQWADDVGDDFMDAVHHVAQWATDVHQWFDEVLSWIRTTWDHIVTDIRTAWDKVVSYTRTIPGKIKSALGDLGSLLVSSGEALIRGLISGIESAIPGLQSVVGWVKSIVSDLFGGGGGGPSQAPQVRAPGSALQVHGLVQGPMAAVAPQAIQVHVNMSNVMSAPAQTQALQQHVQEAVLDFASRNAGSMMVLPTRHS